MNFTVQVTPLTDRSLIDKACSFTVDSAVNIKDYRRMYKSEHSPIRTRMFWVECRNIPSFVAGHFVRHKHGIEFFVKSLREDRGGDENANRWTPVNMAMILNAQSLINMARKRLCTQASKETRAVMESIKIAIREHDIELADCMVADGIYRGQCYEFKNCGKCGQALYENRANSLVNDLRVR